MNVGILRLYVGESGKIGHYNVQEIGLAKALVNENDNIKIYIFFLGTELNKVKIDEIEKNICLVYLPCIKLSSHGIFKLELLKQFNLTVLHILADTQIFSGTVIRWCIRNKIKPICVFGTISTTNSNKISKLFTRIIFSYNKKYINKAVNIAKNPSVYSQLKEKEISNLELIPVGLDKLLLNNVSAVNSNDLRDELGLPQDRTILLFVGRLSDYKKPLFALEVFNELLRRSSKYYMVVIGDGELRDKLFKYIKVHNLSGSISYIDKVKNNLIWQYYKASDLFINTNDKEIFGMSILEAMYYECPVMAVEAPGPIYILKEGKCGYLLKGYDVGHWVSSIENANLLDKSLKEDARNIVNNEFSWDKIADRYLELYK